MNLADKLIRVERTLNIYLKGKGEPLQEISVDNIPFNTLIEIVTPNEDDPLLYDGYNLNKIQIEKINQFLKEKIKANLRMYDYILVCGGIYKW